MGYKINKIMVRPNGYEEYIFPIRLPSTYQQVEYIQSSGTGQGNGQYIDTNLALNSNCRVQFKYSPTAIQSPRGEYRTMGASSGGDYKNIFYGQTNVFAVSFGNKGGMESNVPIVANNIYEVDFKANGGNCSFDVNGSQTSFTYSGGPSTRNLVIFGSKENDSGTYTYWFRSSLKLYYCKIRGANIMQRYFIPCYRKSDSVIGLYDIVNGVFYTNGGSGTFTKGPDIN